VFDLRPEQLVQGDPGSKGQDNFQINAHVSSSFRLIVSAINETRCNHANTVQQWKKHVRNQWN
jgi:hypothetical protein